MVRVPAESYLPQSSTAEVAKFGWVAGGTLPEIVVRKRKATVFSGALVNTSNPLFGLLHEVSASGSAGDKPKEVGKGWKWSKLV